MAKLKPKGRNGKGKVRDLHNGAKPQLTTEKAKANSIGINLLTKFGVKLALGSGRAEDNTSVDFKIVMGLSLGENSDLTGVTEVEYLLHLESNGAHLMIGDLQFEFSSDEIASAIYKRFDWSGDLDEAPNAGLLGDGWYTFNSMDGLVPSILSLDIDWKFNEEEALMFIKSISALVDAISQIAFSCYITSGVVLTDGSFKPLMLPSSKALHVEASDTDVVNAGEAQRRQPDVGID